jgi:hypothetical protein
MIHAPREKRSSRMQPLLTANRQAHGQLDLIYATAKKQCESRGWLLSELDFVLICGDFQVHVEHQVSSLANTEMRSELTPWQGYP